jgi:hypothetical protein
VTLVLLSIEVSLRGCLHKKKKTKFSISPRASHPDLLDDGAVAVAILAVPWDTFAPP